jgi:hypothetical protein
MKNCFSKLGWVLVFSLLVTPVLALVLSLYVQHGMIFWDAKTIPCGLDAMLRTADPNAYLNNHSYQGSCAGYGYEYMQPPGITLILAGFVRAFGLPLLNGAYFVLYAIALAILARGALRYAASTIELVLFAGLFACGAFVFEVGGGNVTIVFVGLLFGLLLMSDRHPQWALWSVLLCTLASAFKPFYALYLLIPLFAGGRWLVVAAATAAISVGYALDANLHVTQFDRWLKLIIVTVYGEPHFGVMRLMQSAGLGAGDWLAQGGSYVVWCIIVLGLLWSARQRLLTTQDRAFAALLAVTLMQPRLKEYDAVVLIPLFFWLRSRLSAPDRILFQRLFFGMAFIVPALWWWGRKAILLIITPSPTITQIADPQWLIGTQGFFWALGLLLSYIFLVWPFQKASLSVDAGHKQESVACG